MIISLYQHVCCYSKFVVSFFFYFISIFFFNSARSQIVSLKRLSKPFVANKCDKWSMLVIFSSLFLSIQFRGFCAFQSFVHFTISKSKFDLNEWRLYRLLDDDEAFQIKLMISWKRKKRSEKEFLIIKISLYVRLR